MVKISESFNSPLAIMGESRFTMREIDVLSCLMSGRTPKGVASLLKIAPKTVESHIRNIMMKIGCTSRESVVSFVERSGNTQVLREHYQNLIAEADLRTQLKDIQKIIQGREPSSIILYDPESNALPLALSLEQHLNIAGIMTASHSYAEHLSPHPTHHIFCIFSVSRANEILEQYPQSPYPVTFITLEENIRLPLSFDQGEDDWIHASQMPYSLLLSTLLQRLLPQDDLRSFSSSFMPKPRNDQESPLESPDKKQVLLWNRKIFAAGVGIFMILGSGGWYFHHSSNNQKQKEPASIPAKPILIKSDLIIPIDQTILRRENLMNSMQNALDKGKGIRVLALVGIGGSGKTVLARHYARQQNASIIWEVNGETHASILSSFEELAENMAHTEQDKKILRTLKEVKDIHEKELSLVRFVRERLKQRREWILIFDNVDEWKDLQKFFPHNPDTWGSGRVIVTTRDATAQNQKSVHHIVLVNGLSDQEKFQLFLKIMTHGQSWSHEKSQKSQNFLAHIPPFPLDVSTAAYYIKATDSSYDSYLEAIRLPQNYFESTQERLLKETGDYSQTRYGVIKASVKNIMKEHEKFPELLFLISLADSQNIPHDLLISHGNRSLLDALIYRLKKYSLILDDPSSKKNNPSTLSLHRSTQQIMRTFLRQEKNSVQLLSSAVHTLQKFIADAIDRTNFPRMKRILPHAESFLKNAPERLTKQQKSVLLCAIGGIYSILEEEQKSEPFLKEGLKHLPTSDPWRVRALIRLGDSLGRLGDYQNGKKYLEESLRICDQKNNLGKARTLASLGNVYNELGDISKGCLTLEESVKIYRTFPDYKIKLAGALVDLSFIYTNSGLYTKSIKCLEESMNLYRKLPENYLGGVEVLQYLAYNYHILGFYDQAIGYFKQSINILQKHFNENRNEAWNSKATAYGSSLLGDTFKEKGDYSKALDCFKKSLEIFKKVFSSKNVYEPWVLAHIGNLYRTMGDYDQAKVYLEKSLAKYQMVYPQDNPETSWTWASLGNLFQDQGDYSKAKDFLEKSLTIHSHHFKEDHIDLAWVRVHLGAVYRDLGDLKQARTLLQKGFHIYEQHYGKEHLKTARVLRHLGLLTLKEGDKDQAKKLVQKSLDIFQKYKHPSAFLCWENLSDIHLQATNDALQTDHKIAYQQHKQEAIKAAQEALSIALKTFSPKSAHIQRIKNKLKQISMDMDAPL